MAKKRNIARRTAQFFLALIKIVLFVAICAALGCAVGYPLWLFATTMKNAYTIAVLAALALIFLFLIARQVKKHGAKSAAQFAIRFLIVALGIFFCVKFVLSGKRVLALPALFAAVALFVIFSKISKSRAKELASESEK